MTLSTMISNKTLKAFLDDVLKIGIVSVGPNVLQKYLVKNNSINLNHNCKMEFAEAKNEIIRLKAEISQNEAEYKELYKIYRETRIKMNFCESRKKELSKEIKKLKEIIETENVFESVQNIEGFDTLLQEELVAISNGMDKADYSKRDLVRLVKEVINFKKLYLGWILESLSISGQYGTLPPQTFYKFTYKTPQGHFMTFGGIELIH